MALNLEQNELYSIGLSIEHVLSAPETSLPQDRGPFSPLRGDIQDASCNPTPLLNSSRCVLSCVTFLSRVAALLFSGKEPGIRPEKTNSSSLRKSAPQSESSNSS